MTPKLIGLTGHIGSGKDTVGEILGSPLGLQRYRREAFADTLKSMALALDPIIVGDTRGAHLRLSALVKFDGWEKAKRYPEVRRFLQKLGTEGVRDHLGEDSWVLALARRVQPVLGPGSRVVITDVRFPNEVAWIHDIGGVVWRIVRPGHDGDAHVSERLVDKLPADREIANDGTLDDLRERVFAALAEAAA